MASSWFDGGTSSGKSLSATPLSWTYSTKLVTVSRVAKPAQTLQSEAVFAFKTHQSFAYSECKELGRAGVASERS